MPHAIPQSLNDISAKGFNDPIFILVRRRIFGSAETLW